jgi:hypothetical protein
MGVWPDIIAGHGSWLPPLDRLPEETKMLIIIACLGVSLLICLIPLWQGMRVLLWGERWEIDVMRHFIFHNGREVGMLQDVMEIGIEGDFRTEIPDVTLFLLTREGKKMKLAIAGLRETTFLEFMEAVRLISRRTRIPYHKKLIPDTGRAWKAPAWWEAQT